MPYFESPTLLSCSYVIYSRFINSVGDETCELTVLVVYGFRLEGFPRVWDMLLRSFDFGTLWIAYFVSWSFLLWAVSAKTKAIFIVSHCLHYLKHVHDLTQLGMSDLCGRLLAEVVARFNCFGSKHYFILS